MFTLVIDLMHVHLEEGNGVASSDQWEAADLRHSYPKGLFLIRASRAALPALHPTSTLLALSPKP